MRIISAQAPSELEQAQQSLQRLTDEGLRSVGTDALRLSSMLSENLMKTLTFIRKKDLKAFCNILEKFRKSILSNISEHTCANILNISRASFIKNLNEIESGNTFNKPCIARYLHRLATIFSHLNHRNVTEIFGLYQQQLQENCEAYLRKKSSEAEIRKNSHVLYQASNQKQTLFHHLPDVLSHKIAGLTGISTVHNEETATQIAAENFERPRVSSNK